MKSVMQWFTKPPVDGPRSVLLLRLMVGGVFFWEGMLKFVYPNMGVGRFTKLGIPLPHFSATFIGCLEIAGGVLPDTGASALGSRIYMWHQALLIPFSISMNPSAPPLSLN